MSREQWLGFLVSLQCKNGSYQGQICNVEETQISLCKVFFNGKPHTEPEVVVKLADIVDLKLIDSQPANAPGHSIVTVAKPIAKRAGRSVSVSECTPTVKLPNPPKPPPTVTTKTNGENGATPNKKEKWTKKWRDEACFGTAMDHSMQQDFDFEKNLALFNKEAVWQELNAKSQKPDVVNQTDQARPKPTKYRHDENVIATLPTAYRQIIVPAPDVREYVTDDGLIIPSITQELRRQLFATAERRGLSLEKQTELMGRAATEMALQLLGGGHRLNPHNTHQWPTVVVLCGPHRQGAVGINCARQLSSHGINTVVYLAMNDLDTVLKTELDLYKLCRHKIVSCPLGLPATSDLIILTLCDDSETPASYPLVAEWTNQNRAPVLAIDPPATSTPGISTKFSLLPVMPLSHSPDNGKLYLCNLGFPLKIFKDIGIKYRSPFGPKFVIPLHPNDS